MLFYSKPIAFLAAAICLMHSVAHYQDTADAPPPAAEKIQGFELTFPALGTLVQIKAFSSDPAHVEQAFKAAQENVRRIESILTDYDSESETRRLTQAAWEQPTPVSPDLWNVLEASGAWHRRSQGCFDSSLGTLTRMWRKHRRSESLPSEAELREALQATGWEHVELDPTARSIRLTRAGIQFDFGAIGKGYIVDRVFEGLVEQNLACCLVNISGNMRCGSAPPDREGWRIAISPLEKNGEPLRELVIVNAAIATSGDLWQYQVIDGVRRSHVLDPHTGLGVAGPIAATVVADNATDADACATVACVQGAPRALELANGLAGYALLVAIKHNAQPAEIHETKDFPTR